MSLSAFSFLLCDYPIIKKFNIKTYGFTMKTTLLFLILTISIFAGDENLRHQMNQVNKNFFIENKGQWPSEVKYLAKVGGMNAWITNSGVVYDYYQITRNYKEADILKMDPDKKDEFQRKNTSIKGHVVKMQLVDANIASVQKGNNKQEAYYNYFIGNDKSKWASFIPLYRDVEQTDIYKSINVKYYFDANTIRYDYIVKPGADLSLLRLKFEGQESISVNEAGELVIKTSLGEVTNGKLYSYQSDNGKQKEVTCRFLQNADGTCSLNAIDYDKNKELIIDPLVYSTYIGGSNFEFGQSIEIDAEGYAYIAGSTNSSEFPTTPGAYQDTYGGDLGYGGDAFVSKLNPAGNTLVYSTFIGGSSSDLSLSIAIDACKNAYITGYTTSSDYPTTPGAYQTAQHNAFVTKLNSSGSALVFSTYIWGSSRSLAIDAFRNVYIAGYAGSDYPTTPGAYQTIPGGGSDAFITKLNSSGSSLVYSTFIGGNGFDRAESIAIDACGNAYLTGYTSSANYPTTSGAYQTTFGDSGPFIYYDAFITKLNAAGSALVYSTFIGGSNYDRGTSIAIDASRNAYITGFTASANYPTTPGAYQTTYNGNGYYDAFITKLSPSGSSLVYSTFIGGSGDDLSWSISIDATGNSYITGITSSTNYPVTSGAYQTSYGGGQYDAFITNLNPSGSSLVYSTFIGGSDDDQGESIAIDTSGNAYIAGYTLSANYPTTPGAFQTTFGGGNYDAFVTKLNIPDESLPVELSSFMSNVQERNILLNWLTQTEKNSNKFIVERKINITNWEPVGSVFASGTSNSPKQYSFADKNLQAAKYQYRLKMIDNDGAFEYSKVIETEISLPMNFELCQNFPNPFNPSTWINYNLPFDSKVTVEIYNITGERIAQLVNEEQQAGYYSINFSSSSVSSTLSSGIYLYRIIATNKINGNDFVSIKKMIILK